MIKIEIEPSLTTKKNSFDPLTFCFFSAVIVRDKGRGRKVGRSVEIKSNNVLEDLWTIDIYIYIYLSRRVDSAKENTDWIDRCKGNNFALLTKRRRIRIAYNQRKAEATLECVHSLVGGSFIEPFWSNVVLQTCYREIRKLNKFPATSNSKLRNRPKFLLCF